MRNMFCHRLLLLLTICPGTTVIVGCESTPSSLDADAKTRTVVAEVARDTQAAVDANTQGLALLDAGQITEAQAAFQRAIDADSRFGPAYNHLGKVYFLRKRYYDAALQFDRASQLMPNHAAPHNNLGLTWLEGGKLDEAVDSFRQALSLDAYTIEYQANLARALVQRGDQTEEVMTLLRIVAEKDERVNWRVWANHQLALMGLDPESQ